LNREWSSCSLARIADAAHDSRLALALRACRCVADRCVENRRVLWFWTGFAV